MYLMGGETHQETNGHDGTIRVLGDTVTESLDQVDILSVIAGVGALEEQSLQLFPGRIQMWFLHKSEIRFVHISFYHSHR